MICFVIIIIKDSVHKIPSFVPIRKSARGGYGFNNDVAAKCFTHYIAESQWQGFVSVLKTNVHFFSFLMDVTTDVSKTEDEAIVILYCKKDEFAKQIQSCTRYLAVANPNKADADSLLQCLEEVLKIPYRYNTLYL